jgi:ornithine cyclodeaminase
MLDDPFGFDEIRVTSRRAESRGAPASGWPRAGQSRRAVATPERLAGRHIMVEATRYRAAGAGDGWVTPGPPPHGTVSAVTSTWSTSAKVVVDDWGQATVGPPGPRAPRRPRLGRHNLRRAGRDRPGRAPGRERPEERTLFWHRGLATTDLAVARLFLHRAAEAGLGTLLRYR